MKAITFSLVFILFGLLTTPNNSNAQDGHWAFKEIIHGNHVGPTKAPDKMQLDVNEGSVEFSIRQNNDCTDRYRFTYRFLQDMHTLDVPEDPTSPPTYRYEYELTPLKTPCFDPNAISYSNPFVRVSHWGASSGLLSKLQQNKTWNYPHHQQFITKGTIYSYAILTPAHYPAGKGSGEYEVTGPIKKDVDYYLENYPGMATDFRIIFSGQSAAGSTEAFSYDILFVYELVKGAPSADPSPCDIKQPDCSCCPGTIPVWNFQTNKGDCLCPEGKIWDKMQNRCITTN